MKRMHARIILGLVAAVLGAAATLGFAACGTAAEDCHNTRTCDPPPCNMADGGNPLDGVDSGCCEQKDGGYVCDR